MTSSKLSETSDLSFTIVNDEATITGASIKAATLKIPTHFRGARVTAIDASAFVGLDIQAFEVEKDNDLFKAVDGVLYNRGGSRLIAYPRAREGDCFQVPEGVVDVGDLAFSKARHLRAIDLADVKTLGHSAMKNCSKLENLIIGQGFQSFEPFALGFCTRIEGLEVPNCDHVGEWVFAATFRLRRLYFHEGIPARLSLYAFADMEAEASVFFGNGAVKYKASELNSDFVVSQTNKGGQQP